MSDLLPALSSKDFATICAEHTRRIRLLSGKFWNGDIDMWHYRKQTRELTQQFVSELQALLNQNAG